MSNSVSHIVRVLAEYYKKLVESKNFKEQEEIVRYYEKDLGFTPTQDLELRREVIWDIRARRATDVQVAISDSFLKVSFLREALEQLYQSELNVALFPVTDDLKCLLKINYLDTNLWSVTKAYFKI
ncbi:hypothetical protein LCS78_25055 [Vibrio harveyi]|uniref:hypothetical protein n=1 Tax=Vibrio harveyi TaxID=669 RepID=UPI003BB5EC2C|nr:hypothetical protein [Vibrio harveyi]